ncbi:MAG: hypothetical protein JRN45_09375 [Nitrososphaerota archaeon]|nr:hypothetical protein [Nitrososphaerota archaeon]
MYSTSLAPTKSASLSMVPLLMVGNLFTPHLWYLESAVIHAYCPVCISLYVLNYAMTALAAKGLFGPVGP